MIDVNDILDQLDAGPVALVDSPANPRYLNNLAEQSAGAGLPIDIVSVGRDIGDQATSDLADSLFQAKSGTVVVLSPTMVSGRSALLSPADCNDAVDAASAEGTDEEAMMTFINFALGRMGSDITVSINDSDGGGIIGGIDVDAIIDAFGDGYVAVSPGVPSVSAADLEPLVEDLRTDGLDYRVGVLSIDASGDGSLTDVATAVMHITGGTVLLISPSRFALASDTFNSATLQAALDAGAAAQSLDEFVRVVADSLMS